MSTSSRAWCPGSGSHDGYTHDDRADDVRCQECGRLLYLTKNLRLPRHLDDRAHHYGTQVVAGSAVPVQTPCAGCLNRDTSHASGLCVVCRAAQRRASSEAGERRG